MARYGRIGSHLDIRSRYRTLRSSSSALPTAASEQQDDPESNGEVIAMLMQVTEYSGLVSCRLLHTPTSPAQPMTRIFSRFAGDFGNCSGCWVWRFKAFLYRRLSDGVYICVAIPAFARGQVRCFEGALCSWWIWGFGTLLVEVAWMKRDGISPIARVDIRKL